MGYFKQGNLILKQTQKVQVQDVDISNDGTRVEVNATVQSEGLQIGSGPVITSISNSIASDSTAELMTSASIQGAIDDAVSAFSGSGGAEPLASIFKPREDIQSSRYNVQSQDISTLNYDDITASATDNRFGVCALKSGLVALASRDSTASGITVEYYKENGDSVNSLSLLTQYSSATLGPAAIKDMASTPSGKLISIFAVESTQRYLIAVNENCTQKIELQLPYSSVPYAYGVLPNDEVVMYAYNGSTYSMGIYKPDFDSSSFIAIKAFAAVTDGTGNGTPLEGPTIKFIGSNQVVVPSGNGAQIINLESHKYVASNEFTVSASCLVEVSATNTVAMIGATSTPSIYAKTFDFSGNDVTSEQIIVLSDKYDQGVPNIRLLPSGDFIILYQGVGGYIRYIIVNSLLETLYEGVTTIASNSQDCASGILPNGKLLIGSDAGSSVNISVLKFVGNTRKDLYMGDTVINNLQVSTSPNVDDDNTIITSNVLIGTFGNFNDKVSPFSKNRYMSGSGIFGQGELDWEYSSTPMWIKNIGDVGADVYRSSYVRATMLSDGNLCVFYRGTISRDFFALTLDPTTFEVLNTETWDNTISTSLDFKEEGVLKTWDGVALILTYVQSPFPSGTSILMAYHQNTGWFSLTISSQVRGYCVLDNNDILLLRHNDDLSKIDMAVYRADIDTTSFISVVDWVDFPVPFTETSLDMRLTPLGNGKFLCNDYFTKLIEFDLNGNYKTILKTDYGLTVGTGFCLDNRIIIIGKDSNNKTTIVILDKQYNLLETISTEFGMAGNTFTGIPEILSNGDITFSIHDTDNNHEPIAIFIKPNNEYQITSRYRYTSSAAAVNSKDSNPIELPNGNVLYIDYSATSGYYIFGRLYKKVNKWTDKIEVLENLNRRNHGTYNQKIIKYQPQLVYKNTTPSVSYARNLGYFNNGKLLIIDTALYSGTYWHPHISILDQNNNLKVNLKPITFPSDINLNQHFICNSSYQVLTFNNNPYCLFVINDGSAKRKIVVVNDDGDTLCEPFTVPTDSAFTIGLLENDDILLLESGSFSNPPGYNQGSGYYARTYRVTDDSTSLITIQPPINTLVLAANGSGNIFPFDSNTMIGIYNNDVNIIDSKTFSIRANRLYIPSTDAGTTTSIQRNPPSLDGKHFYINSRTYVGPYNNVYIAKYKYDRTNEEVSFVDEVLVSSGELTSVASFLYMFATPYDYLAVPVHSISSGGVYKEGVMMLDRDLNETQPDDYLYFGATETYSSYICATSRSGEVALLGVGISTYDTYVKKFKPVIEMTSPMNACVDVNYFTDQTSNTTINIKHLGQVLAYSSTTAHTLYVPSDSNDDLPLGFTCTLARLSSGDLSVAVDGGGVAISSISGNTSLRVAGSTAVLTKIDRNKWQLSGDLD